MKRAPQPTILEAHTALTRPMDEVLKIPEPVCSGLKTLPVAKKPKTLKKAVAGWESAAAKEALDRAAKAKEAADKDAAKDESTGKGATEEQATRTTTKEAEASEATKAEKAKGEGIAKEQRSKLAADCTAAKGSSKLTCTEVEASKKQPTAAGAAPSSHDMVLLDTDSEVAASGRTMAHPLPSMAFNELHRLLGNTHEMAATNAEMERLNKEVAEAAKKNARLLALAKKQAEELTHARDG
ncbi:hypothetical protein ACQ4PT_017565 [Festuca glaucescens]